MDTLYTSDWIESLSSNWLELFYGAQPYTARLLMRVSLYFQITNVILSFQQLNRNKLAWTQTVSQCPSQSLIMK